MLFRSQEPGMTSVCILFTLAEKHAWPENRNAPSVISINCVPGRIKLSRSRVPGSDKRFRVQPSRWPKKRPVKSKKKPRKREYRISNNECRISKECILSIFKKKMERSDSTLRHSIFVIRYSAVRCSVRLPTAKATSLIISKP